MDEKSEHVALDEKNWKEVVSIVEKLSDEQIEEPGLNKEGWSVKDLLWHLGCWSAESARELERIRMGTYVEREYDTDEVNAEFLASGREMDLATVRAEWISSRNRALQEWAALDEITPDAEEWFSESAHIHYADHLPELRNWADKLAGGDG